VASSTSCAAACSRAVMRRLLMPNLRASGAFYPDAARPRRPPSHLGSRRGAIVVAPATIPMPWGIAAKPDSPGARYGAQSAPLNWRREFRLCWGLRPSLRTASRVARVGPTTPKHRARDLRASVDPTDARKPSMLGKGLAVGNAIAGVPPRGRALARRRDRGHYQAAVSGFLADGNGPHAAQGPPILQLPSHGDSGDGLTRRGFVTLSRYNEETSL
jgi:hypothetical protein